jgi:hypothetical protein
MKPSKRLNPLKQKNRLRKKEPSLEDPDRRQKKIVQKEYDWLAQQNMRGGPSNLEGVPFDKRISDFPDLTITFVKSICKFS